MGRIVDRYPVEINEGDRTLCLVPLGPSSDYVATIWKEDYDFLMRLGLSPAWLPLNVGRYVYTSTKKNKIFIARVLLDAKPGHVVRYRDNDPWNLKRENLILVYRDIAKKRDRELVMAAYV